jgi:galactokinase
MVRRSFNNNPVPSADPVEPSRNALEQDVAGLFTAKFHSSPECIVTAPGRVNLIGEHVDYNGGFVLPAAINRWTSIAAGPRNDTSLFIHAENLGATMLLDLKDLTPRHSGAWSNYTAGVAHFMQQCGLTLKGANLLIKGTIPRGSGLSSSAALEVASAYVFLTLNNLSLPSIEIVKLCQKAENDFVGVKCGIMDQFISCLGKKDHVLKIDCRSLDYDYIPFPTGVRLVVCDTAVKRALAASEYNKRREECNCGVAALARVIPGISMLRDVTPEQLRTHESDLDPTVRKRCRHVVSEIERVEQSAAALRSGDLPAFGQMMYASHASLRDDYEVSCKELDAVVEISSSVDGVLGARMTGAGFGGCAICLVRESAVEAVTERLRLDFPKRTGKTPGIVVCTFEDGVSVRRN